MSATLAQVLRQLAAMLAEAAVKLEGEPGPDASSPALVSVLSLPAAVDPASMEIPPQMVTLSQMAAWAHRSKRTLERYKTLGCLPDPDIEGGGGMPALWRWDRVRGWLMRRFNVQLPERLPDLRTGRDED